MVLLNKYYQLIERNTDEIHVAWKVLTVATFVLSSLTGLYSTFCFSNMKAAFGENCILNSQIIFLNNTKDLNEYVEVNLNVTNLTANFTPIDLTYSMWGKETTCNFCGYTPIVSTLFATVWAAFYIMCPKGGRGYSTSVVRQPFRLIYPSLICAIIYIIAIWISSFRLADGVRLFCEQFEQIYGTKVCSSQMDEYTLQFHRKQYSFYVNLVQSVIFSYATLGLWICSAAVILLRLLLVVDFKLQQVSIHTEDKDDNDVDVPTQDENEEFELEMRSKDLTFDSAQSNLSLDSQEINTVPRIIRSSSNNTRISLPSKPFQKTSDSEPQSSRTSYYSLNETDAS